MAYERADDYSWGPEYSPLGEIRMKALEMARSMRVSSVDGLDALLADAERIYEWLVKQ